MMTLFRRGRLRTNLAGAAAALVLVASVAAAQPPEPGSVQGMQGTIATFDAQTRAGTLLLDDGTELVFDADAFQRSGLRLLRLGQRVDVETEATGLVSRVAIPGIG